MNKHIYYTKPSITDIEINYAADAVKNGWGDKCYEYIEKFETSFKEHLGTKHAIATSSCTGALHMGLTALGIKANDEVILADTNWIASAAPIIYLGAKPVFVDILPDSWCLDPVLVEKAITHKTKAIIAVHLYGNLCEMSELLYIGEKYNIPIIEDAAEAIGSVYNGQRAGSMGKFGTFSFHGTKTITTGEGGIFVTNDDLLYERVHTLSNHGRAKKQVKQFWPEHIGYKYKISNIQAAIGLAQMKRVDELISRKREIFQIYAEKILKLPGTAMNPESPDTVNGYWMPTVAFATESRVTRDVLLSEFKKNNIDARVFFYPLSSLPAFNCNTENVCASNIAKRAINLPSYHEMTAEDQFRVIRIINRVYKKCQGLK